MLAPGCVFSVSPTSALFATMGGPGRIYVTGPPACLWSARSNASWITITSGGSGAGNGAVAFSVPAYYGINNPRTATLSVAGQTVTVTQIGLFR